jgi:hypothetical protein
VDDEGLLGAIGVEGPVTAEIFVVARDREWLRLGGPCGPAPWLVEAADGGHPMAVVDRLVRANLNDVILVHSTSWRWEHGQTVLSFLAVVPLASLSGLTDVLVDRAALARGTATQAAAEVPWPAVLEHGLRHLAWLVDDDPEVAAALDAGWHAILADYVPEPFRHLGGPDVTGGG